MGAECQREFQHSWSEPHLSGMPLVSPALLFLVCHLPGPGGCDGQLAWMTVVSRAAGEMYLAVLY